ncbi:hypothetical protein N8D56_08520 [Devosia sp. A8/3-2]|nr:hypothetical protein N8D56_08520 [Devosia sp. A8/3-2]
MPRSPLRSRKLHDPAAPRHRPAAGACPLPTPAQDEAAETISSEIFGPRANVDYAFGAFQRGYFLTALEYALPCAERAMPPPRR